MMCGKPFESTPRIVQHIDPGMIDVCLDKMRSQWHGFVILLMIKTNDYVVYAIYALSGKWLLYAVNPYIKEGTLF